MPNTVTIKDRMLCIRYAINRIKEARAAWHAKEQDPASSTFTRILAKQRFQATENEFHLQWENVEAILDQRDSEVLCNTRRAKAQELVRRCDTVTLLSPAEVRSIYDQADLGIYDDLNLSART